MRFLHKFGVVIGVLYLHEAYSFRSIRFGDIFKQPLKINQYTLRESLATDSTLEVTQGPIIEKTFNTIDPLTEIYGPENPEQANNVINEVGKVINDLVSVIPPALPLSLFGLSGLFLLLDYAVNYARSQIYIAELYSGIPKSVVDIVEIDAVDPKTMFYIPKNTSFIGLNLQIFDSLVEQAMFGSRLTITEKKQKEMKTYEYLIEQAMNQVNTNSIALEQNKGIVTGKARFRTSELSSKSSDCMISVNAFQRLRRRILRKFKEQTAPLQAKLLDDEQTALFKEIYRVLRPGGLFCFYEAIEEANVAEDGSNFSFIKYLRQTFPAEIKAFIDVEGNSTTVTSPPVPVTPIDSGKKGKKSRRNFDAAVDTPSPALKEIVKPAIVYQVRPTLPWRKYVIGIAIKPFN